ncbi:23S rRNA (pseudouridine(1915)-N(3))-methyltransferase RlmH [Methanolobus sp. ZRKC3]|uniref:23S rRNA (pseudouridine(1915)-N(3))-methyltransferase RlmH n=1 Tax=Methanolobus sp. ZRKC3 TaxID=3125786 RepID=UPI003255107F
MKITIISVGKIKEKHLRDAIAEYGKRLSGYCTIKSIEVTDEKAPENMSDKEMDMVKGLEADRILSKLKAGQHVIALDLKGAQKSSESFAGEIEQLQLAGKSDLAFIIGGSLGLHGKVTDRANELLSFSKMTFPHQLMKVILMEQIYRAFRIIKNEPYHK